MINKGVISTGKFMPKVNCGLFRWLIVPIFACIVAMLLTPSPVSAYTMSINTSQDASVDITPSDDSNNSARITNDEVIIVTNCKAGYNLTLSSSVNDNNLYLDGDSSNNTSGTYFAPSNGTTTLNNATNTWGYFFSSYSRGQSPTVPTTTSVFSPVPTLNSTPAVLKTTTQTASSTDIDDTLNVYLGVNMDNGMTPGSYKMIPESNQNNAPNGSLVYYLTMDGGCRNYTVSFNPNGGTGTMSSQDITVGEATNLAPNSYTAPALGESYQNAAGTTIPATAGKMWTFWGWNTAIDGSGDWYKDRESVTDLAASGSIITLYAQWKQATLADLIPDPNPSPSNPKTIDHDTMQDMSAAACWNSEKFVAIGTPYGQTTLKDTRDGNNRTYTVAKLPDGLCWMTQNLNLGTSTPITLTANDTDLEEGTTFTLPASNPTDFTTGTGQANTNKATVYNDVTVPDYTVNSTVYSGKINAYYSYAAATADTSTYGKGGAIAQINTSICPKNWDLPTNVQYYVLRTKGSIASYNNTNASYVGKNAGNEPYYFIYGGYRKAAGAEVNTTNFYNPSTYGYLWTANNYSTTQGRGTYVYSSGLYNSATAATYSKYYGLGVRCVSNMDNAAYTITYTNTDTSATQTQEMVMGESAPIQPATTWTRTGYRLMGWDTNNSGTNVVYTTGQSITPSSDMTLYTVWKPSYTLQYNGNGSDAGVMTNVKHTNVTAGDVFDLFASNYSKANYGFAGWSFNQNAQPGGASKIYGPNEAIEAPAPSTPGETKTLYAVWVPAETGVYMQTWNGCPSMNVGDVIALKDQRDNNVYTVGKLADENCWMMENLRLDTANSSDATKAQGFGGAFVGLADSETANFSNSTTANTLNGSTLYSTANITGSNQSYRFPRYNNTNTSARSAGPSVTDNRGTATTAHTTNLSTATYSYGNYYTWAAAKANTDDLTTVAASEAANTSICPAGWMLPYGGSTGKGNTSGGFYYLGTQLGATASSEASSRTWRSYPNNVVYSGYTSSASFSSRGSTTELLTATATSLANMYRLTANYNSNSFAASTKYFGLSVRCLIQSLYTITYNGNNADSGIGMSVEHSDVKKGDEVSLYAANYKKAGYGFAGWSTEQFNPNSATFADDLADAVDDGLVFGPNETITINNTIIAKSVNSEIKLYAVWVPSAGNIQNWNGCNSLADGSVIALKDTRDNNVYAIAKFADGNCWMMENLRLNNTATINASNTNSPISGFTLQNSTNPSNWCENSTDACISQSIVNTDNTTSTIADMTSADQSIYSYGNYYNWYSATAGNGTYNSTSGESAGDLCPAGWKLPTGSAGGTYSELDILLGGTGSYQDGDVAITQSAKWRKFPINRVLSGLVTTSISRGLGSFSWTSTAKSTSGANGFRLYSDGTTNDIYPGTQLPYKYRGSSIRCIARNIYSVVYNGNNSDSGIGMSVQHNNVETGNSIDLYAPNYKKAGYGFVGWSTEQLNPNSASFVSELTAARNAGLVFGPNETISFNRTIASKANNNNVVTLYAVWMQSAGNMQNWNSSNACDGMSIGGITALKDTRDNQVYAVAKLADGNCWMIENMRLNTSGSDDETKAQGFGGVFAGLADPETTNFSNSTTANSLYYSDTQTGTASIDIGSGGNPGYRMPRYNNTNTISAVSNMTSSDQSVYSYGNYYSWAATIANTTPNTANNTSSSTSICPAGWRLPEGGDDDGILNSDYWNLIVNNLNNGIAPTTTDDSGNSATLIYSGQNEGAPISKQLRSYPNNFILSGYHSSSSDTDRGSYGRYWTSTASRNSGSAYGMTLRTDVVRPGGFFLLKYGSSSIRCVAQKSYSVKYNGNNADSGIGMSIQHSNAKTGDNLTLYAANYKKAGYGFVGWSTEQLNPSSATFADDLADAVDNGLVFGPNETIQLNNIITAKANSETMEITLYAVWIPSAGNIQNWNGCSSLSSGAVTALTDTRDNNVYAVAKLADGNCWMIENLRLDNQNSTNRKLAQGYNSLFTGLANPESANFSDSTTANSKYSTTNVTGDNQSSRIPRYNNANTASTVANMTSVNQNIYSYGNYYNTPAAMADTGDYTSWQKTVSSTSICPTGWHLPYGSNGTSVAGGNTSGGFVYLDTQLGGTGDNQETAEASNRWRKYPNNFIYAGSISDNAISDRGESGSYISPTSGDATHTHHVGLGEETLWPGNGWTNKYVGESVRCVYGGFLYDAVEGQSKGTMASNNVTLNTTITQANSGVYTYDKATYGNPSDASNTYPVYFYRGILDTNAGLGTYGSNGQADAYPNYVKTSDGTCWRIIRTTGSGGVKMIYNGKWGNNTCAKATTAARVANSTFSATSDAVSKSIVAVGYSYNATYAKTTATTATAVSTVFGSNSSYSANSTKSTIKNYIEGTYAGTLSTNIKNMLEPSAGYCNDRKLYSTSNGPVSESATIVPYGGSQTSFRFGGYVRVFTTTSHASLTCPRATVDLYTTSSASNGNKQLTAPIALITVDELVFAGHGNTDSNTKASTQSFLNTGNDWWTMSPGDRDGAPNISAWYLDYRGGNAGKEPTKNSKGVRPVVSMKRETIITSGSGTATDPWIVE